MMDKVEVTFVFEIGNKVEVVTDKSNTFIVTNRAYHEAAGRPPEIYYQGRQGGIVQSWYESQLRRVFP